MRCFPLSSSAKGVRGKGGRADKGLPRERAVRMPPAFTSDAFSTATVQETPHKSGEVTSIELQVHVIILLDV